MEEQRDPETYDDTEFYQNLLREFLDGKQGSIGSVYSVSLWYMLVMRSAYSKGDQWVHELGWYTYILIEYIFMICRDLRSERWSTDEPQREGKLGTIFMTSW